MELVAEHVFKSKLISRQLFCLHYVLPRVLSYQSTMLLPLIILSLLLFGETIKLSPFSRFLAWRCLNLFALTIHCSPLPTGFFQLDVLISNSRRNLPNHLPYSSSKFLLSLFPIVTAPFFLDSKPWWWWVSPSISLSSYHHHTIPTFPPLISHLSQVLCIFFF